MKAPAILTLLICIALTGSSQQPLQSNSNPTTPTNDSFIRFRKNMGQWENQVLYRAGSSKAKISFLNNGVSFAFLKVINEESANSDDSYEQLIQDESFDIMVWNMYFENMNPDVEVKSLGKEDSKINYINHHTGPKAIVNVPDFHVLKYDNLFDGIDLKYYGTGHDLKYDFILRPGADISDIKLRCEGINKINLNRKGELEIETEWGTLLEKTPYSYQIINGIKKEVDVRFELYDKNRFGFVVYGEYDKNSPLIIDPVILKYSTWVGGNYDWQYIYDNTIDKDRNHYGTGYTINNFPTTPGVIQQQHGDGGSSVTDAFLFKLSTDGSSLVWSTYIGGYSGEYGHSVEVDDKGYVYLAGSTKSTNFPITTNAWQTTRKYSSAFILKLNPSGSNLEYSTFVDGVLNMRDIALNKKGEVFWTGYTTILSYQVSPTAVQPTRKGSEDMIAGRLNATGSGIIYSTYIGGTANDNGEDIEVNDQDEAFITGYTLSDNFPTTTGAYKTTKTDPVDGVVLKLSADGSKILYSTYFGGGGSDYGWAIDVNKNNEAYITGRCTNGLPTSTNAYKKQGNGVFVAKFSADGSKLLDATYIGGGIGTGIKVSSIGEMFITGWTTDVNYPTTTSCNTYTSHKGRSDVFVSRVSADFSDLQFSALYGGSNNDYGGSNSCKASISIYEDACGAVEGFMSVTSHSSEFPTTIGAFQETKLNMDGDLDQPVAINLKPIINPLFKNSTPQCSQPITFTDQTTGNCVDKWSIPNWNPTSWYWDFGDGTFSTEQHPSHMYAKPGTYTVKLLVGCPMDSITKVINIPNPFNTFDLGPDLSICPGVQINETLDAGSQPAGVTYKWNDGSTARTKTATSQGKYWVTISNGTCSATDTIIIKRENMGGSVDKNEPTCAGEKNGSIKAIPVGGTPPYTYQWGDGQITQTATGLGAGSHTIKVIDSKGCELNATLSLEEPVALIVTLDKTDADCSGNKGSANATASGGTGAVSFTWSNGATSVNGSSINNLPVGSYTLTATDGNGCKTIENFEIIQDPSPIDVNLTLKQNADCSGQGGSATVTPSGGTGPYTYKWNSGQTARTVTNLNTGTYTVTVTDALGCTGSLDINIDSSGDLDAQISGTTVHGCDRDGGVNAEATVTVGGGAEPYIYEWSNGQTTATATGLTAGTHSVKVSDQGGCTSTATITINEIMPLDANVVSHPSCDSCADGEATVWVNGGTAPYTYRWNDENQQTTANATGLKPGVYVVTVTDDKDCRNTDTVSIGGVTGIKLITIPEDFIDIYPNPNNGTFNIEIKQGQTLYNLNIYDITGKLIHTDQLGTGIHSVNTQNIIRGIYFVELLQNDRRITKRIHVIN